MEWLSGLVEALLYCFKDEQLNLQWSYMNMINKSFIPGPRGGAQFSVTWACLSFLGSGSPVCDHTHLGGPGPVSNRIQGTSRVTRPLADIYMDAIIRRAGAMRLYTHGHQDNLSKWPVCGMSSQNSVLQNIKKKCNFISVAPRTVQKNWNCLLPGWVGVSALDVF